MPTPLVTIEQFAGYLKRSPFNDFDAYTAQLVLDGASEAVTEYCGWHIAPVVTETVTVDGTGTLIQTLPTLHLVSLDSVDENGLSLNVDHIDWSTNGVMEKRRGSGWTARRRGIIAGIHHGFGTTPGWVTTMICAVAGRAFKTPLGVEQETAGGESIKYTAPRPPVLNVAPPGTVVLLTMEKRMLDRIRVPLAA
jgi:hypothetical protein